MAAEWEECGDFVRIGGGLAVGVDRGSGWQGFSFAFQGLNTAHGDCGGGPVHDDGETIRRSGGDAPGVGVGAEGWEFPAEGDDFGEGGGAVGVGEIAALGGFHHVAAAPQVVEGVVHGDLGDAVLVGELDGAIDGAVGD